MILTVIWASSAWTMISKAIIISTISVGVKEYKSMLMIIGIGIGRQQLYSIEVSE